MRLQAIKLAGFKSFVDPTTVSFPGNLCAVIGPNGCGKSNIIDAVRWVMGEFSARNLRGESMTDVIFNGSNTRKPIGQASIELLFDNTEGRLAGEYAGYSEISIKRRVGRDGQSGYFLNGHKCRRKDITDIFLGTGLGPRSYSIIEQGMISQLIEAKPEDLRMYLEEAAGISKYRERRRETERRIRHTRENLSRLNDLRTELQSQLQRLERQAKAADRYISYREEERNVKAGLQALHYRAISEEVVKSEDNINRLTITQDAEVANQRRIDADIEQQRQALADSSEELNEVQRQYYAVGTEIARIENGIQNQDEKTRQLRLDLEHVDNDIARVTEDLAKDERLVKELTGDLRDSQPEQHRFRQDEETSGNQLQLDERALQEWQLTWDDFNQISAEARQKMEVQQSGIAYLEQSIERQNNRMDSLKTDLDRLHGLNVDEELDPLEETRTAQEAQLFREQKESAALAEQIEVLREDNTRLSQQLDGNRGELQRVLGRRASLEALQQAALGQQDDAGMNWLSQHDLAENPRLAEKLKVENDWVLAVETVLGETLQAVVAGEDTPGVDGIGHLLKDFSSGSLRFISTGKPGVVAADRLAARVSGDVDVTGLLHGIYTAENLTAALVVRESLEPGESVVTRDGLWLGTNWLRVRKEANTDNSVINRQTELDELAARVDSLQNEVANQSLQLTSNVAALTLAETNWDQQQKRLAEQQTSFSETQARIGAMKMQSEQAGIEIERMKKDLQSCESEIIQDQTLLGEARTELQNAMDQVECDVLQRAELLNRRDVLQGKLEASRSTNNKYRESAHQLALTIQALESRIISVKQAVSRLSDQRRELATRRDTTLSSISDSEAPKAGLKKELKQNLAKRLAVENELTTVRRNSEAVELRIRELETLRSGVDEQLERVRGSLEEVRLEHQTLEVRRSTIREQMVAEKFDLDAVLADLPEDQDKLDFEDSLRRVGNRIQRLGAINLAAVDEFRVQSERKQYLDSQNEDLEKALNTLNNAIRKIDGETRTRFKETFDKVNGKLQQLFPKLFGGGHAYLEMTGQDLLDTGVGLMARPPGKRNSSIHLLSGGEKALTAIALVFSIFSLNPAPFCLLDEVDAPLDDVNVARYSDLVREMSRTIQFIYITHNKIAMEMGEHLMGVTMQEPGVSRLVSVDVEEAVALAAM